MQNPVPERDSGIASPAQLDPDETSCSADSDSDIDDGVDDTIVDLHINECASHHSQSQGLLYPSAKISAATGTHSLTVKHGLTQALTSQVPKVVHILCRACGKLLSTASSGSGVADCMHSLCSKVLL